MEKFKRVPLWARENIYDKKIIGAESLIYVYTWIYSAYAVQSNIRSHNWGTISMVNGVLHEEMSV